MFIRLARDVERLAVVRIYDLRPIFSLCVCGSQCIARDNKTPLPTSRSLGAQPAVTSSKEMKTTNLEKAEQEKDTKITSRKTKM